MEPFFHGELGLQKGALTTSAMEKNCEQLGGGILNIYYFHSEFVGKMNSPILAFAYFSNGLVVQPPTRKNRAQGWPSNSKPQ